jgi:L-ascorbate metabolism protein UlaG (beta-lactamase superfamily)
MQLTWYGTAGFRVETSGRVFLIDPYLGRNDAAYPALKISPADIIDGGEIYLSHGHFDHASDVPQIARQTGATIYCSEKVAEALRQRGVDDAQIAVARGGGRFDFDVYRAECFNSAHVTFDLPLLASTLWRCLLVLPSFLPELCEYGGWPQGQVLSWRFTLAAEDGRVIHHFGSAGWTAEELARLEKMGAPDVLMLPLQGHTHICRIATHAVEELKPSAVIPHHHDDFCPPISQMVDTAPFAEAVGNISPSIEIIELQVGEPAEI